MKTNNSRIISFAALAFIWGTHNASAVLAVTNLDQDFTSFDQGPASIFQRVRADLQIAMSFTTGSSSAQWIFESVDLRLGGGSATAPLLVELHVGSNFAPSLIGIPLIGVSPAPDSAPAIYRFSGPPAVILDANTTYWVTLETTSAAANSYDWTNVSPNNAAETGLLGWSLMDGWAISLNLGEGWASNRLNPRTMSINASPVAVPELGSVNLAGVAALGLLLRRREIQSSALAT